MTSGKQITKLNISTCKEEEENIGAQGYQLINVNLSQGTGGNKVFLWFKKESGKTPVTRIEFSFTNKMKSGLVDAGYEQLNKDLNAGAGGDFVFLWYFCGSNTEYDIPIVGLKVTKDAKEEPALLKDGWERVGCELNRNSGVNSIYLWVKREKTSYIKEIAATVDFYSDKYMFELGYSRVGEDTNRSAPGNYVFLWYRRTTDKSNALTALDVSMSHQDEEKLQNESYKKLNVDLNTGTRGNYVFLWYKKGGCQSIQAMYLLNNSEEWIEYQKAGFNVIEKNLNEGNNGWKMYIAYL